MDKEMMSVQVISFCPDADIKRHIKRWRDR